MPFLAKDIRSVLSLINLRMFSAKADEFVISEIIPFDDCQRAIDSVYSGENVAVLLKP